MQVWYNYILKQKIVITVLILDPNYKIIETPLKAGSQTPMNTSAISWRSNISPNESKFRLYWREK